MQYALDFSQAVYGQGRYLYTVTHVDTEDSEDTFVELWFADSEEELFEELVSDMVGDTDYTEEELKEMKAGFESDVWGRTLLVSQVAEKK